MDDDIDHSLLPKLEESPTENSRVIRKYKIIKSIVLTEVWFCVGLTTAILTPTMLDMTDLLQVNIAQLSVGCLVSKGVGMLIGSPVGGILSDRYRRHLDLILAVEVGLECLSTAAVPWAPNLLVVGLLFALSGFVGGGRSATGNAMILTMWGKEASSPLQFIHGGYGVGLTVTPLFTAPFLSRNTSSNATSNTSWSHMSKVWFPYTKEVLEVFIPSGGTRPSRIYIPYGICGVFGVIASIALLIFYFKGPPRGLEQPQRLTSRTWKQVLHPSSYSESRPMFGIMMVMGLFFVYIGIVSKDRSLNSFITTYAVEELNLTKSTASLLTTAYFASYTCGRYVSMLLALFLPVYITIFGTLIANFVSALSLILFGLYSEINFWVLSLMFGFTAGPVYPSGLVWADRYIEVTAVVVAVVDLGIAIGFMTSSWLGGYLYQYVGRIYVIELAIYFNAFILVILTLLQVLGYKYGVRWRGPEEVQNLPNHVTDEEDEEENVRPENYDYDCQAPVID